MNNDDAQVRRIAAYGLERLEHLGDRLALQPLMAALNDEKEDVRKRVATALLLERVTFALLLRAPCYGSAVRKSHLVPSVIRQCGEEKPPSTVRDTAVRPKQAT